MRYLKKTEEQSTSEFVIQVRALADSLFETGDRVSDRDMVGFVGDGLSKEYRLFMCFIHSQPKMLFEEFFHLIVKEDLYMKRYSDDIPQPSGFAAKSKKFYTQDKRRNDSKLHKNSRWKRTPKSSNSVVCQLCDKVGHSAKTCIKGLKVFAAIEDSEEPSEGHWLLDSGASNHMTPDLEALSDT